MTSQFNSRSTFERANIAEASRREMASIGKLDMAGVDTITTGGGDVVSKDFSAAVKGLKAASHQRNRYMYQSVADQRKEPTRLPEKRSVYSTAKGLLPKNTYSGASSPAIDSPAVLEGKSPHADQAVSPLVGSIGNLRALKTTLDKLIHSPASQTSGPFAGTF